MTACGDRHRLTNKIYCRMRLSVVRCGRESHPSRRTVMIQSHFLLSILH